MTNFYLKSTIILGALSVGSAAQAALSPFMQSARELNAVMLEASRNLQDSEILNALQRRGGTLVFETDEMGYSIQSNAAGPCTLRFELIYAEPGADAPGPRKFSVKKNTAEDVICPYDR